MTVPRLSRFLVAALIALLWLWPSGPVAQEKSSRWPGVDETVVEKFAAELGRPARGPIVDTDQGDLLLFLFTLAGAIGGFIVGYTWHKLFVAGRRDEDES